MVTFDGYIHEIEDAIGFQLRRKLNIWMMFVKIVSEFRNMTGIFEQYKRIVNVSTVENGFELGGAVLQPYVSFNFINSVHSLHHVNLILIKCQHSYE